MFAVEVMKLIARVASRGYNYYYVLLLEAESFPDNGYGSSFRNKLFFCVMLPFFNFGTFVCCHYYRLTVSAQLVVLLVQLQNSPLLNNVVRYYVRRVAFPTLCTLQYILTGITVYEKFIS